MVIMADDVRVGFSASAPLAVPLRPASLRLVPIQTDLSASDYGPTPLDRLPIARSSDCRPDDSQTAHGRPYAPVNGNRNAKRRKPTYSFPMLFVTRCLPRCN